MAASAAFYDGMYWYGAQGTDELHQVTFDADGNIANDTIVGYLSGDAPTTVFHNYGDIDFDSNGLLYMSFSVFNAAVGFETAKQLATYNVSSDIYTILREGDITDPSVSFLGQIAFDAKNTLYNHNTATGSLSILSSVDGSNSPTIVVTKSLTDISFFKCHAASAVAPEVTTTTAAAATTTNTDAVSSTAPDVFPSTSMITPANTQPAATVVNPDPNITTIPTIPDTTTEIITPTTIVAAALPHLYQASSHSMSPGMIAMVAILSLVALAVVVAGAMYATRRHGAMGSAAILVKSEDMAWDAGPNPVPGTPSSGSRLSSLAENVEQDEPISL
jgi:hypothetical protein